jgi:tRNA (guanine-N7-)-methyltransferase
MKPVAVSLAETDFELGDLELPLALAQLVPGGGRWEAELGFGKGRYLLRRAAAEPETRFVGLEMAGKYFRLARRRRNRLGLRNLVLVRGEALYLMSVVLPRAFAAAIHIYFPDPWPKSRHHKRRLFDSETVDLVLGLLAPGGQLHFATDCMEREGRLLFRLTVCRSRGEAPLLHPAGETGVLAAWNRE